MGEICRLCCSTKFVNHYIFDDNNSLYLKMSLYLPFKVMKNDRLPQKICDNCCYKINEFYQFYNRSIEIQHRLRLVYETVVQLDDSVDLTIIKQNSDSPPPINSLYNDQSTQTDNFIEQDFKIKDTNDSNKIINGINNKIPDIKNEPRSPPPSPIKNEADFEPDDGPNDFPSDDSDDMLLIDFKASKNEEAAKQKIKNSDVKTKLLIKNSEVKENKKGKKSKNKINDWFVLPRQLVGENMLLNDSNGGLSLEPVKQESVEHEPDLDNMFGELQRASEQTKEFFCCICFTQYDSKREMLFHYKTHASKANVEKPPAPPPVPEQRPLRCFRCKKVLEVREWTTHWRRHWERDRRPYRCSLCDKTFRDPHQIQKHGLTHKLGEVASKNKTLEKHYICDLCPEGFVFMNCLVAHRSRAHPEAACRALALRCGTCARSFAHLNSLRRHLRAHSGERNYLCNMCGKALTSQEHLKFHLRIHTGYKPNVCKTCGKGFVKKCNLTLHERVHSGEKPHVCAHCGKAFSQRSTLVIHERYHSGARPYKCSVCGRGFVAKGLLSMHLKSSCVEPPRAAADPH